MVVHFDRFKSIEVNLTLPHHFRPEEQLTETSTRNLPVDNDYVQQQHPSVIT